VDNHKNNMKKMKEQEKIGIFIKELREREGLTQSDFAKALATSQSAVARMEKGEQNFSTDLLGKISDVLGHKLLSINSSIDFK
jgi:transcriptional regulator with XRE-family HTH domain